jgi:O-antigen/teichoic acid export membrane protein
MRQLIRAFLTLSPLTATNVLVMVAQFKLLAVLLGARGTGFYSLALAFMGLLATASGLGLSASLPKLVAEFRETRPRNVWPVLLVGIATSTLIGLTLGSILVMSPAGLTRPLLGGGRLESSTLLFLMGIGVVGAFPWAWAGAIQGFAKGLRSIALVVRAGVLSAVAASLLVVLGAVVGDAKGAVIGAILGQTAYVAIYGFSATREARRQRLPLFLMDIRQHMSYLQARLWYLGIGAIAAFLAASLGQTVARSYVAHSLGLAAVGLFAAAWALSNRLPLLIYQTFSTYTVPRLSALGNDWSAITKEQNWALRLGLLLGTPALCGAAACLQWLIPLVLSRQFLPGRDLMLLMLVGEAISIIYWATTLAFYPTGRAAANAFSEWGWWAAFVGLLIPLTEFFGLKGAGMAYTAAYAIAAAASWGWEHAHHGFSWSAENRRLIVASLAAVVIVAGLSLMTNLSNVGEIVLAIIVVLAWAGLALSARERDQSRAIVVLLAGHVRQRAGRSIP